MQAFAETQDMLLARAIARTTLESLSLLVLETAGGSIEIARDPDAARAGAATAALRWQGAPARSGAEPAIGR